MPECFQVPKGHHTSMLVFRGGGEPHLNVFKCKKITTYEVWFLGSWVPHLNVFSTKRSPYLNVGYSSMVIFFALKIY